LATSTRTVMASSVWPLASSRSVRPVFLEWPLRRPGGRPAPFLCPPRGIFDFFDFQNQISLGGRITPVVYTFEGSPPSLPFAAFSQLPHCQSASFSASQRCFPRRTFPLCGKSFRSQSGGLPGLLPLIAANSSRAAIARFKASRSARSCFNAPSRSTSGSRLPIAQCRRRTNSLRKI